MSPGPSHTLRAARHGVLLGVLLLIGAALRAWMLASPLGELEADEAVIGLMALHAMGGDHSAFFWGQAYLGSLQSYLAAGLFTLVGPSTLALKLVPAGVYLVFALLTYWVARRDLGRPVALLSLAYLALPPSFLAIWSTKARGAYVEVPMLGQGLALLAPLIAAPTRWQAPALGAAGLLAGLALWTHLNALVFVVPFGLYVVLRLRRRLLGWPLVLGLFGLAIGLAPAIAFNLEHGFETISALSGGGSTPDSLRGNLLSFVQVGLPVLVGLGQPTTSPTLLATDWPTRPGSWAWTPPLLLGLLVAGVCPALAALIAGRRGWRQGIGVEALWLGLSTLALAPLVASLGRYGELVGEPRYAMPIYAGVPVLVFGGVVLARRWQLAGLAVGLGVLIINLYSLATIDPRLNLPTTAGESTAANRAELLAYLERSGQTEIYTDYWLAYPLMFESQERVLAAVSSGGFDRLGAIAYYVAVSQRPAFVFLSGSPQEAAFEARLAAVRGRAERRQVSIYSVYSRVEPLEQLRPGPAGF